LRFKGSRHSLLIATVFVVPLSGCLIPNKDLVRLENRVEKLSKENAAIRADQKKIKNDLKSQLADITVLIRKGRKRSDADYAAELDVIRADFQNLSGRVEEFRHMLDLVENDRTSLYKKISAIEEEVSALKAELSVPGLAATASSKAEEEKPEEAEELEPNPNELYKSALGAIMDGKTKKARALFRKYLKNYSDQPLANNAQFWFAESYYDEKEYERAIIGYDEVIKKYPLGSKVPAALLKQGMAFEKINDRQTAVAVFKKLIKKYPDSDEARKAAGRIKGRKK